MLSVSPSAAIRAFDHHRCQPVHVLAAECRLDHCPGASPDVSIADDQAIPEQHFHPFEARPLVILAMAPCKDPAHLDGIVHEVCEASIRRSHTDHVSVFPLQA